MKKLSSFSFLIILGLFSFSAHSQSLERQVVAGSGAFFSNGTGSLSSTLGEPMSETYSSSSNDLTQGFQQVQLRVTGLEERRSREEEGRITVFPNPTDGVLKIHSEKLFPEGSRVQVRDLRGKLLLEESLQGRKAAMQLDALAKGSYLLRVLGPEKELGTYRIQKL